MNDTLARRFGASLQTPAILAGLAAAAAIAATALAATGYAPAGIGLKTLETAAAGAALFFALASAGSTLLVRRRLRHQVLDAVDEMSARLRKMIIAGVNDVRPLDSGTAPEVREVWAHYQKLAAAVERARVVAQAAIDTNKARTQTAADAAAQAIAEKTKGETDPLTQIFNRRRLDADLERDAAAVLEAGASSFAFVMVDVDHFKSFNDTYGHQKGDEILQGLARILKDSVRGLDTAYRYGGEEFSLILRNMNPLAAFDTVERIRAKVEAVFAATDTPMTASFGVALAPQCAVTPETIMKAADNALYESKEGGRNRVSLAPPMATAPATPTAAPAGAAPTGPAPAPTPTPPTAAPAPPPPSSPQARPADAASTPTPAPAPGPASASPQPVAPAPPIHFGAAAPIPPGTQLPPGTPRPPTAAPPPPSAN